MRCLESGRIFPVLKTLSVEVCKVEAVEGFAKFLEKHPLVEGLNIYAYQPNLQLFTAIERRSAKLREFSLYPFSYYIRDLEQDFDWGFLRELTFLKKVFLHQHHLDSERQKSMREVMSILPASLESVKIFGVDKGDWNDENPYLHIIPNFSRLRCVTKFLLGRSENSVTDLVLQCICSTYSNQLLELDFASDQVTDYGITGRRGDENTGISLNSLRGEEWEY